MYWSLKTYVVFLFNNFSFRTTLVFIPINERPGKKWVLYIPKEYANLEVFC